VKFEIFNPLSCANIGLSILIADSCATDDMKDVKFDDDEDDEEAGKREFAKEAIEGADDEEFGKNEAKCSASNEDEGDDDDGDDDDAELWAELRNEEVGNKGSDGSIGFAADADDEEGTAADADEEVLRPLERFAGCAVADDDDAESCDSDCALAAVRVDALTEVVGSMDAN
jgi:hypothetical protein